MAGAWRVTARALTRKVVVNRKKVRIPPSSWRTTGLPLWCILPYCCAAVVDWSVRTAPLPLYCCGGGLVSGWWGCTWVGRMCGIVRGCVFVPVGDGSVFCFFSYVSHHTNFTAILLFIVCVFRAC